MFSYHSLPRRCRRCVATSFIDALCSSHNLVFCGLWIRVDVTRHGRFLLPEDGGPLSDGVLRPEQCRSTSTQSQFGIGKHQLYETAHYKQQQWKAPRLTNFFFFVFRDNGYTHSAKLHTDQMARSLPL